MNVQIKKHYLIDTVYGKKSFLSKESDTEIDYLIEEAFLYPFKRPNLWEIKHKDHPWKNRLTRV